MCAKIVYLLFFPFNPMRVRCYRTLFLTKYQQSTIIILPHLAERSCDHSIENSFEYARSRINVDAVARLFADPQPLK